MNTIPFDIPSYRDRDHAADFIWPTPYNSYDFLSYGFIDGALKLLDGQKGDMRIAMTCKLSDIIVDLANLVRQAWDLQQAREAGHDFVYDRAFSPTCDWLKSGGHAEDLRVVYRLKPDGRECSLKSGLTLRARQMKRMLDKNSGAADYNAINFNLLMKEWIASENISTTNLLTELYVHGCPHFDKKSFAQISDGLRQVVCAAYSFSPDLKRAVDLGIGMIVEMHLSQALGDLAHLKASKLHKHLRKGLISGTPKYEGRMLGWYFLDHGKDVIRFAHGGERVFYQDYAWPIAELPYCSQYLAHSKREAENMNARVQTGGYAILPEMKKIHFSSHGSAKHQFLFKSATLPERNKTLVYVTSVYEHDEAPGLPAFKIPDVLYFDFQLRLLKFLRGQGWRIILKPHPKGLYMDMDYLTPYVDETVKTPFDANAFKAEVFLFDFAGTAFFDSLATKQRVALLNLGYRPFDPAECGKLAKRCALADLGFDARGRVHLDQDAVVAVLQDAPESIDDNFIMTYAV